MPIDVSQGLRQGETKAAEAMKDETDKL